MIKNMIKNLAKIINFPKILAPNWRQKKSYNFCGCNFLILSGPSWDRTGPSVKNPAGGGI
jgi:hypothetical protein